eukprot:gene25185-12943_t
MRRVPRTGARSGWDPLVPVSRGERCGAARGAERRRGAPPPPSADTAGTILLPMLVMAVRAQAPAVRSPSMLQLPERTAPPRAASPLHEQQQQQDSLPVRAQLSRTEPDAEPPSQSSWHLRPAARQLQLQGGDAGDACDDAAAGAVGWAVRSPTPRRRSSGSNGDGVLAAAAEAGLLSADSPTRRTGVIDPGDMIRDEQ